MLTIDNITQCDALSVKNKLLQLQKDRAKYTTLQLSKCGVKDNITTLVSHCILFDQVPTLLRSNPTIASATKPNGDTFNPFIVAPAKPENPCSFFNAPKSPHSRNWKSAAWKQFKKNKQIVVFSASF